MSNLADYIEQFILSKIRGEREEVTVLKRNELAEELECAPSQISYVLSTRFTVERGFMVESRRGLGGFVRIVRIPVQQIVHEDAVRQVKEDVRAEEAGQMLRHLQADGLLSRREAELLKHFFDIAGERLDAHDRTLILRSLIRKLLDNS
ncbi:MAG TPA: CtsR family transcriptional regulator [Selenomonadales bacterium]|nr:CtsR family transcriptional regulator [Selenomonadales bacterium]